MPTYGPNFGPSYTLNQNIINQNIVAGATILASSFQTVLTNINAGVSAIGDAIGSYASFGTPFSQADTIIGNIITGYSNAIALASAAGSSTDPGALIYKYRNLGGF